MADSKLAEPAPDSIPSLDPDKLKRRPVWPVLAVIALLFGGIGVAVWQVWLKPKPKAHRVLLLVGTEVGGVPGAWWGRDGRSSARCADAFAEHLGAPADKEKKGGLGLDVVPAGDPGTLAKLDGKVERAELLEAARSLEAGLVLFGTVKGLGGRALAGSDDQKDFGFELALELVPTEAPGEAVHIAIPQRFYFTGATEEAALDELCPELPKQVLPRLAVAVSDLPLVDALAKAAPNQRNIDETTAIARLDPLFKLAHRFREATKKRAEDEKRARESDAKQEHGKAKKTLVSEFLGEEYYVGAGPGEGLVLMSLPRASVLKDDTALSFTMGELHEQLRLATKDGSPQRLLLETFNVFSFPSVSADGKWVAAVLDNRQWSKSLVILGVDDASLTEVASHRAHYFSTPRIAPDGSRVAYYASDCRNCPESLALVGRDGKNLREILPGGFARLSLPYFTSDGKELVFATSQPNEPTSVWVADAATGARTAVLGAAAKKKGAEPDKPPQPAADPDAPPPVDPAFDHPVPSPDGSFFIVVEESADGTFVGRFDRAAGSYKRLAPILCTRLEMSPDGKWVAVETPDGKDADDPVPGDIEIALVSTTTGEVRQLTLNGQKDTLAGFSRDGKRVFFHQGNRDADGHAWNNRVYWVEP
ncbi:MAG: hypothetical protein HY908_34615 [Myxococcales bacterium]|nr:hypothetical protein [Myxococcales bacterium]